MDKVHGCALAILALTFLGCPRRVESARQAEPPTAAPVAAVSSSADSSAPAASSEAPPAPRTASPAPTVAMQSPPPEARQAEAGGEDLVIPFRGGVPRYPEDFAIGPLGRGGASAAAYRYARSVVAGLADGSGTAAPDVDVPKLAEIRARYYRLGTGMPDGDDSVSFLFRLIGPELSVAGELHLQVQADQWVVRDLLLEDIVPNTDADGGNPFDPLIYKRFL